MKLVDESQKTEVREAVYPILSKAAKRKLGSGRIPRDDLGYMSIQLLGKLGFAKADLPVLIEVIDTYTSYAAAGLEKSINDPLVQEYIDKSLTSSKFSWSTPAHKLVQKMGSKGEAIAWKALEQKDDNTRCSGVRLVSTIGTVASIEKLDKLSLSDSSDKVRKYASWATRKLKVVYRKDRQALKELIDQHNIEFNSYTVSLVGTLGPGGESLLWKNLVTANDSNIRSIVRELEDIGTERSIPHLEPLLNSKDSWLRSEAKSAIQEIKKKKRQPVELWAGA